MRVKRIELISLFNTFVFLIAIISLLFFQPIQGFELSIYSTNWWFWIFSTTNIIINIVLLFLILQEKEKKPFVLYNAIYQIIFLKMLMLSFWAIRGYAGILYRGDQATYIGYAKDILFHGTFFDNFYPFIPILSSSISLLSDLVVEDVTKILPGIFYLLYLAGIILVSKEILGKDMRAVILPFIFASPFIFNWFPPTIYFHMTSVYFFPLIFYCLLRISKNTIPKEKVLSCILLSSLVFWHPFTSITALIFLFLLSIRDRKILNLSIFYAVVFSAWFINQWALVNTLSIVIEKMFTVTTAGVALSYAEKLGFFKSLQSFSLMVFDDVVFYCVTLIALFYIIKAKLKNSKINHPIFPALLWWALSLIIIAFLMFGTRGHVPDRLVNLNWSLLFSPVLATFIFLIKPKHLTSKRLMFVILSSTVVSIFALYPSPIIVKPNQCNQFSEVSGANWVICNSDEMTKVSYILSPLGRYSGLIYGTKVEEKSRFHIGHYRGKGYILPSHFNLTEFDREFLGKRIFILSEYEKISYSTVWRDVDRFDENDFKILRSDSASDLIYDNGHFEAYLIDFQKFKQ